MTTRRARLAFVGAVAAAVACARCSKPTSSSTSTATSTATATATAMAMATATGAPADAGTWNPRGVPLDVPLRGCRAMVVRGDVREGEDAGTAVRALEFVDSVSSLELAADAGIDLKSARTGRETSLAGPGRARVCVAGDDEIWLTRGTVRATANAGTTPGAELLVVTPYGSVRAAAADVTVRVDDKGMRASATSAGALVWTPDKPAFTPLAAGATREATAKPPLDAARASCERAAAAAESIARAMANDAGSRGATLGDLAARHLEARQAARAACKVARVRVETETPATPGDGGLRKAAEDALDRADERWTRLP